MAPAASPYDDPVPRGWRLVRGTLRIGVALQFGGLALLTVQSGAPAPGIDLLQFFDVLDGVTPEQCETYVAYALIASAVLSLLRPCWPVLFPTTALMIGYAAAPAVIDENSLETASRAAFPMAPLALMLLDFWPPPLAFSLGRCRVVLGLLRLSVAAALIGHCGLLLEECVTPGDNTESVTAAIQRLSGRDDLSHRAVEGVAALAAVSFAMAISFLSARSRSAALMTGGWGLALAALPLVAVGPTMYPQTLSEAAIPAGAFAVAFFWICAVKEQAPVVVPAT